MMNDRQAEQNQKPYRRPFHPSCQSSSGSKPLTDGAFIAEITEQFDITHITLHNISWAFERTACTLQ